MKLDYLQIESSKEDYLIELKMQACWVDRVFGLGSSTADSSLALSLIMGI